VKGAEVDGDIYDLQKGQDDRQEKKTLSAFWFAPMK